MIYYLDYLFLGACGFFVCFALFKGDSLFNRYIHTINVLNVKADRVAASLMRLTDAVESRERRFFKEERIRIKEEILKEIKLSMDKKDTNRKK